MLCKHILYKSDGNSRDDLARNARTLTAQDEALSQLNAKLDTLLAQTLADRTARRYEGDQGKKDAGQQAVILNSKMDSVIQTIENLPENAVPLELKDKMLKCTKSVKVELSPAVDAIKSGQLPDVSQTALTCDQAEFKAILNELEQRKQHTLKAWEECRETLLRADAITNSDIPLTPSGIARDDSEGNKQLTKNLKVIAEQTNSLGSELKECGSQLGELYDQMRNQEDGAAAIAMAMNMVATVCSASGGNPYVCGGAFFIAILSSLFSDGGGDGDGDGNSDGTGERGDGSNVPGTGTAPGPSGSPKGHKADSQANGNMENGNTITGTGGNWQCTPVISGNIQTINCTDKTDSTKRFSLASNRYQGTNSNILYHFANMAKRQNGYAVALCGATDASDMIGGIIIYQPDGRYLPVPVISENLQPEEYKLLLNVNLKAITGRASQSISELEGHCSNVNDLDGAS
ncbi:hypothetical protein [Enterovibrio coralii]|uniref:Uncharacterized protein n=1 Tax=Enterovibrio coralii TaxID=294935 RepID=A0A135IBY7_9GAMM|nr:hypothetical protein [Enterovibrio coralii]KXF82976.1 hypothetical protein ATN88_04280 [Enterovibrio coralii]